MRTTVNVRRGVISQIVSTCIERVADNDRLINGVFFTGFALLWVGAFIWPMFILGMYLVLLSGALSPRTMAAVAFDYDSTTGGVLMFIFTAGGMVFMTLLLNNMGFWRGVVDFFTSCGC